MFAPPARPRARRLLIAVVLGSYLAGALAPLAHAQVGGGPIWVALDAAPAGTPAEASVDPANSSPTQSSIILVLHGFYVTPRTSPDGTPYSQIDVPGLQRYSIVGAPEIPILRKALAIVTGVQQVTLTSMTPLAPAMGFSYHVWPHNIPAMDDSAVGSPEVWAQDPALYASDAPFPAPQALAGPVHSTLGSIPSSTIECYPMRWTPASNQLQVFPISRWTFSHDGPLLTFDTITQDRNRLAAIAYLNWSVVNTVIPPSFLHYQGEYLFVYPSKYAAAIQPLVNQKYWRGWNVTKITTESIGSVSCNSVRTAIINWYNSTPSSHDHDCLLVGDVGDIPFCGDALNPDARSDDPYGSVQPFGTEDVMMERDIFVGRLPGFSATDISGQVTKIINYEDHPPGPLYYGDVLLVAHKDDPTMFGQGNFPQHQEGVRTTSYKVNPLFVPYYGSDVGKNNAGVNNQINNGYGIVCYRGHGWYYNWTTWDQSGVCPGWSPTYTGECYGDADIAALHNSPLNPIVWAIACNNANLDDPGCIGRAWVTKNPGGAVAHYGATRASGTLDNTTLEDSLFMAVWTYGVTNLAHATTFAEDEALKWNNGEAYDNAFEYTLFGDPDMTIRREKPPSWQTVIPSSITLLGSGQQGLDILITDDTGLPVRNALIGVFKPGAGFGAAARPAAATGARPATTAPVGEVMDNTYTGSDGHAHFLISPQTPGFLYLTARDSTGGSVVDSIPVVGAASVGAGPPAVAGLWATPSVTRGGTTLHFGRALEHPATLTVFDAAGRAVATFPAPAGAASAAWSGRDEAGMPVRSGLYFVRLDGAGERRLTRMVVRR